MSNKGSSGDAAVFDLSVDPTIKNFNKLITVLEKTEDVMDGVTLAMIARVQQFDKALSRWGDQASKGTLSAGVEAESAKVIRALTEAQRDIERLVAAGTKAPAQIQSMIASRLNLAAFTGQEAANLKGKGGIWSSDRTPEILPQQDTFNEKDRARAAALAANRVNAQRSQNRILSLAPEITDPSIPNNYGLGGILSPAHESSDFAAQLQAQMEQENIPRLQRQRAEAANAINAQRAFAAQQQQLPVTAGADFSAQLRQQMEQENLRRIQDQRQQISATSNIRGLSGEGLFGRAEELHALRGSLGAESGLGRDVSTELAQVQNALDGVSAAIRRANSEQLELKLGGIREHIRDMRQLRTAFAYSDRERDLIDRERQSGNITARAQSRRSLADQRRAAGTLSPEDHDAELRAIARQEQLDRHNLDIQNFLDDRNYSATNVSGIRSAGISELRNKQSDINALAARGEGDGLTEALTEIQQRIERINATELRIRIGGNPEQRLAAIDQELRYTLGEEPRAALQRDRSRIVREQGLQRHLQRLDQQHVGGTLNDADYNRRRQQAQERFEAAEENRRQRERREEWDAGAIDPQTGRRRPQGRVPGQGGDPNRPSYGNTDAQRRFAYQAQNIAFGIDDAIQSSQYGGLQGAIRGATNNVTAVLSTMFTNPMVAAATVVGASFGALLLPHLIDTGREAKNVADNIRSITDELGRMQARGAAKLDIEGGTTGSDERESQKTLENIRKQQRKLQSDRDAVSAQIAAQGNLSPAGPELTGIQSMTWLDSVERFLNDTFSSDSHSEEDWYRKKEADFRSVAEAYESWLSKDAKGNVIYDDSTDATWAKQARSSEAAYAQKAEELKRNRARTVVDGVDGKPGLQGKQAEIDAQLLAIDLQEQNLKKNLQDRLDAQARFRTGRGIDDRASSSAVKSFDRSTESSLPPEENTVRNYFQNVRDAERRALQARQADLLKVTKDTGGDAEALALQFEHDLVAFDEQWKDTIHGRVEAARDALTAFERAENPYLSDSLKDFLGKKKNAAHLADSGIADLSDPTLRMHKQEQQYWEQVKADEASAKGMRNSIRGALDPTRNVEETLKQRFEEIDDMQIDLWEKTLLKEGLATQAQNDLQRQNIVRNTNSGVESGSMRSLELQQLNFQAANPVVTAIDKVVTEQRLTRQSIERQRNMSTVTVYRMI